jgi:hypothetical protein
MSNEATGAATIFALKKNTLPWGTGAAVACGAGDQIEVEGESFTADSQLIENMGLNGQGMQLPGVKGNELHGGSLGPIPIYYRGIERIIAPVLGVAGAPVQQGADLAYKHSLRYAAAPAFNYTVVAKSAPAIREWPHVRWNGFEINFEDGKYGVLTAPGIPSALNFNIGSPITNRLVVSVAVANGAFTIANQPTEPSPFTLTITDANASITEFWVTVTGTDRDDNFLQVVYKLSVSGLTFTSTQYFKTVTSIVGSNLAGTAAGDTIVVGVSNGVNNDSTVGSISLPSTTELNMAIFAQLTMLLSDQTAGTLVAADEVFISKFMLKMERQQAGKVTTKLGNRADEPVTESFIKVSGGFNLPDWNTETHAMLKAYLFGKPKKKLTLTADGPLVNGTTFAQMKIWLQNCQFSKGTGSVTGPGRVPLDIEFEAKRALVAGSGFPDANAIAIDLINGRSTDPLA